MAIKLPIRFPIFAPPPSPQPPFRSPNGNPFRHRPSTEIRFSRWNKAIGDKFNQRQRALQEIEDEIRRERRFESATNIANTNNNAASPTAETFKSIGTPSSPSSPSIPGKKSKYSRPQNPNSTSHPAFRRISRVTKLPQTPKTEPINTKANVTIGKDGVSYVIEGAPFEFKYSYTETPKAKPLKLREPPFAPFGPATMPRPWTGRAPLPPSKKKLKEFDSFQLPPPHKKGVKPVQSPGPYLPGTGPRYVKSREEILGEPLTKEEIMYLVDGCLKSKRQLNMGRDGLTHNMLDNIHSHWKRRRVCKIKCKGVCTVDMDNVCQQLEERTGGKIIYSRGGVLYLFRGRNYNYRTCPRFPLMLWKPVTPVYPRLIKRTPEGLTMEEAIEMRKKGRKLIPICKLGKNGIYSGLVGNVREAFEECELVRINCQGMNGSDYRKIGAKLKDLVPCVLSSFENEHILMWRGQNWKSSFPKLEDVHKEAGQSDIDGAISIASPLEDQQVSESRIPKVPVKEDVSIETLDTNTSIMRSDNVGADGNEDQSSIENDKPYAVDDVVSIERKICESEPISHNKNSAIDESEPMSSSYGCKIMSDNNVCADEEPVPMSVGSEIMMGSFGSTGKQMEPSVVGAIIHDDAQDVLEASQDCSEPASMGASCTKEILLLLKQAVDGGSAIVLDNTSLDADSVYERAVALSQSAPPGPVFRHRHRKVAVQKCEKEERGDLVMKEERGDLEMKELGMKSSETNGSERESSIERGPKFRRIKDLDEKYLAAVPQGSLKVDELAKLLA